MKGDAFIPWLVGYFVVLQMVVSVVWPVVVQPLFYRYPALGDGEEEKDVKSRVERLARRMRYPMKYLSETGEGKGKGKVATGVNTMIFGFPRVCPISFCLTGLINLVFFFGQRNHLVISNNVLKTCEPEEVEAVVGKLSPLPSLAPNPISFPFPTLTPPHPQPPSYLNFRTAHDIAEWRLSTGLNLALAFYSRILLYIALFPAFTHASPVLRAFDFDFSDQILGEGEGEVPTFLAWVLFQVCVSTFCVWEGKRKADCVLVVGGM